MAILGAAPLAVVLAIGTLLRFGDLGGAQLFRDEAASWLLASYPLGPLLQHNIDKTYPPLYELILSGWMAIFGTGEAALRSPSAVPGVITLVVAWRWSHEALGKTAGVMTAAILAVSALVVDNSREARMYELETAFATVSWWLAWRLAANATRNGEESSWRTRLSAILLAGAVAGEVWTMAFGLAIAALQMLFAIACFLIGRRADMRAGSRLRGPGLAVVAIAAGAVSITVWLPSLLAIPLSNQGFWTPKPDLGSLRDTFYNFLGVSGLADLSAAAPITAIALTLTGLAGLAVPRQLGLVSVKDRDRGRDALTADADEVRRIRLFGLAAVLGTALVGIVWVYSQVESVYDPRYLGAAAVPFAALIAAGFVTATRIVRGRIVPAAMAVAILAPMTCGAVLAVGNLDADVGAEPGQQAAAQLESLVQPGDVALALDAQTYLPLDYYLDQSPSGIHVDQALYDWNPPGEPFYIGAGLIESDRLVAPSQVASVGWETVLPGLRPGGTIWLVTITNGSDSNIGFAPLADGSLVEQARETVFITPTKGGVGQIRALEIPTVSSGGG